MNSYSLEKNRKHLKVLTIVWSLLLGWQTFGQIPNEPQPLLPNQTIEREMTGAETHRYKFDLQAGEFFQARVEQKGVDVVLKLTDASGNALATMDSPNGKEGFETLSYVATKAGGFILEVNSPNEKAGKGNYTIRREASRTATEKDKRRVEVERIFDAGIKAIFKEGQEDTAITNLEKALKGWQELEDAYLIDLTDKNLKSFKENKYNATFNRLFQRLQSADRLLEAGSKLAFKSKSDSIAGREKLTEALMLYRALLKELNDIALVEKIQKPNVSQASVNTLWILQYVVKSGETNCLERIGQTYYNLGEWQEYITYKKFALADYQEIISNENWRTVIKPEVLFNIKLLEVQKLKEVGESLADYLGKKEEGLDYLKRAVERAQAIYKETSNPKIKLVEVQTLQAIAFIYGRQSKTNSESIEYFNKALEIFRTFFPERKNDEAEILSLIGVRYMLNLQYEEAGKNFESALRIFRDIDNKWAQSNNLQALALMFSTLNNKSEAAKYANQNLEILQSPDYAENYQKNFEKNTGSLEGFEVFREKNNLFIEYQRLGAIALSYRLLEDYPKSLEFYEKTLVAARASKDSTKIRLSLYDVGFTLRKMERSSEAVKYFSEQLEISRQLGNGEYIADSLQDISGALLDAENAKEALKYQNESLVFYQSVGIDENKHFSLSYSSLLNEISRTHYALGNKRLAIFYGKRAVNAMQGERRRLQNLDLASQKGFLEKKVKHYRRLADWLIEAGRFADAEQILRMLKEEEFSQFVRRDPEEINKLSQRLDLKPDEKKALEKYSALADNLAKIGVEYEKLKKEKGANCQQDARCQELNGQLEIANRAFTRFLKELEIEFKKVPKRDVRDEIDTERARQVDLQKWNAVSIYTLVGEERLRVFLTTSRVQTDRKKEIKAEELNKKIADFRKALTDSNVDPRPLGKELYDILIAPIEKQIKDSGAKTLLFSLDGTLRYIPVAALWDGEKYLVEKYQIVLLTSKTKEKLTDENKVDWKILGGGVTEKSEVSEPERKVFGGLPAVRKELDSIIRERDSTGLFEGKKFINGAFTRKSLEDNLSGTDFNVLHLATHFKLGRDDKTSFLLLGNNKTLTLDEISNSNNIRFGSIDLVVLSACETAFGNSNSGGEGGEVDSSATFFELKGAKSIIASLWSVADNSTSELMIAFYQIRRENPNLSKAETLRIAQLKLLNGKYKTGETPKWRGTELAGIQTTSSPAFKTDENAPFAHPYYWSPFILIGNWK